MTIEQAIQEDNIRKMQDEVIYEFGFENLKTIWFFKWCERYSGSFQWPGPEYGCRPACCSKPMRYKEAQVSVISPVVRQELASTA